VNIFSVHGMPTRFMGVSQCLEPADVRSGCPARLSMVPAHHLSDLSIANPLKNFPVRQLSISHATGSVGQLMKRAALRVSGKRTHTRTPSGSKDWIVPGERQATRDASQRASVTRFAPKPFPRVTVKPRSTNSIRPCGRSNLAPCFGSGREAGKGTAQSWGHFWQVEPARVQAVRRGL
jgi:hypothetical protein